MGVGLGLGLGLGLDALLSSQRMPPRAASSASPPRSCPPAHQSHCPLSAQSEQPGIVPKAAWLGSA